MKWEPFVLKFFVNGRFQREPALAFQYVDDFAVAVVSDKHGFNAPVPHAVLRGFKGEALERDYNVDAIAGERTLHFCVETGAVRIGSGLWVNRGRLNFIRDLIEVGHAKANERNERVLGG